MRALSPPIHGYAATPAASGGRFEEGIATLYRRMVALAAALALALASVGPVRAVTIKANADTYSDALEDTPYTVDAGSGVLANDSPNSGTCVVASIDPSSGSLGSGVAADGSFTFTPMANFSGQVTFTYDMAAGGDCPSTKDDTATVTITVNPVNDAPTISAKNDCADGSVTVAKSSGPYAQACVHFDSAGPSNESSQTLDSWVVVGISGTVGFSSAPSFSKSGNDGLLEFTPAAGQTGDATVSVQATDSGGNTNGGVDLSNVIDVHIHVVDSPPVANADSFIVLKNTTLNVQTPGVLINDSDPNGDAITAVKVTSPAHGVVTLASDGSFSYTPANGFEGLDAFSYKASDGQLTSATKVVALHVTAIPPVPTPTPEATVAPEPTGTPEATPTEATPTEAPTATDEASPTAFPTPNLPTPAPGAAATPTAPPQTPAPGTISDSTGGVPLPVVLVLVLLVLLLGFGAAVFVPRWIKGQRGDT